MMLLVAGVAAAADPGDKTWSIANEILSVSVSARDAGAVCSLKHAGKELVNDHDHGRQLQVAWAYNDLDEAYNPTEAGSGPDGEGPTTTSRLVAVSVEPERISTTSHPAFWRHTKLPERHRKNTALFTNDTLTKQITLGHGGDPHVMCFETAVTVSSHLTGPEPTTIRIEAPTMYCDAALSRHWLLDLGSGVLKEAPPRKTEKDRLNVVINRVERHDAIPIVATDDGRHAVALYAPSAEGFWGSFTWAVPSDDPTNACTKITVFFKHPVEVRKTYSYRTFVVVGDLATVQASLATLRDTVPRARRDHLR